MCECFTIGGPFIAEDPDCPIHGRDARSMRQETEDQIIRLEEKIARLESLVESNEKKINIHSELISKILKVKV